MWHILGENIANYVFNRQSNISLCMSLNPFPCSLDKEERLFL